LLTLDVTRKRFVPGYKAIQLEAGSIAHRIEDSTPDLVILTYLSPGIVLIFKVFPDKIGAPDASNINFLTEPSDKVF
jgi:hypothetical protein